MKPLDTKSSLEDIMEEVLGTDPLEFKKITKSYALISTPRSGSSMFAEKLRSTNLLGDPKEWLNLRYIRAYSAVTGIQKPSFGSYLKDIICRTSSKNGVFGVNFHVDQFLSLQKRNIDIFRYLKFDQVYAIERENKLAQAFSLAKARVTDIWSSKTPLKPGDQEKIDNISNSFVLNELKNLVGWSEIYDAKLARYVREKIIYERVLEDTGGEVFYRIAAGMGQKLAENFEFTTELKAQSNSQDKERIKLIESAIFGRKFDSH